MPQTVAKKLPMVLTDLKEKNAISLNYKDLVDKCSNINVTVSEEEVVNVEKRAKQQCKDKLWYDFRAGRITASNMKPVYTTDMANPSQSLVKKICYPNKTVKTEATKWGIENESVAKSAFIKRFSERHENAVIDESGLLISVEKPYIAASPDGIVSCDCCGKSCIEIKCPFSRKYQTVNEELDYLYRKEDGTLCLSRNHSYYFQVQTQLVRQSSSPVFLLCGQVPTCT